MLENSEQSSLDIYLRQIATISLITVEEEIELAKKIADGDEKAREKNDYGQSSIGGENCTRLCTHRTLFTGLD